MSQNKITRESLANEISKEFGIAYSTAYKKIDNLLNIWSQCFLNNDLSISSLGTFQVREKNSRIGRNPKTKEEHIIEPRRVISFKKSKKLKL